MENWVSYALSQDSSACLRHWQTATNFDAELPFLAPDHDQLNDSVDSSFPHLNGFLPELLNSSSALMFTDGFMEGSGGGSNSSRSHSEAEKRRRDRINAHLATLRKLIPKADKMDKAALLGSVIEHVKDMKKRAMEINRVTRIPSAVDEVIVDDTNDGILATFDGCTNNNNNNNNNEGMFLKACISCDDRPELFSEINDGLKNLRLTIIHADIISLGGRVRSKFLLDAKETVEGGKICMISLKKSLKIVLSRIVTSCSASNYRVKSRRQRFFFPSH